MSLWNFDPNDTLIYARSEYEATLQKLSPLALYDILFKEHDIRAQKDTPKAELINKILTAKYGKA